MSNLASGGDDHPDAAGKHFNDATVLVAAYRFDGAAYLAGYVAECSLKTLVIVANMGAQGLTRAAKTAADLKHNLNTITKSALQLASLPNSATAKYVFSSSPIVAGWSPRMRYSAPSVQQTTAIQWLAEAKALYAATVAQMRLDGVIR